MKLMVAPETADRKKRYDREVPTNDLTDHPSKVRLALFTWKLTVVPAEGTLLKAASMVPTS
jgi:hypothetical protein